MAATPSSESGTSRRGLRRLRRNKAASSTSTNSLYSNPADVYDGNEGLGLSLRASIDSSVERVRRARNRASSQASANDNGGNSDSPVRRLSSLISRKKRDVRKNSQDLDLFPTGDSEHSTAPDRSQSSLILDDSRRSSLLTSDESIENDGISLRPSLSRHESHSGYLTLSSPEINDKTNTVTLDPQPDDRVPDSAPLTDIPLIIEPDDTTTPPASPTDRSFPSAEKIKGALTLARKKPNTDADSVKSASSVSSGFGNFFRPLSRGNGSGRRLATEGEGLTKRGEVARDFTDSESSKSAQSRQEVLSSGSKRDVATSPLTPSNLPDLVEPPTTLVTPPTPTDLNPDTETFASQPLTPPSRSSGFGEKGRGRRGQSVTVNIPSKLSHTLSAPLSPTIEETKTPGGTLTQPSPSGGFFATVFTAAQRAADQFTSSTKPRPSAQQLNSHTGDEQVIPVEDSRSDKPSESGSDRTPAVQTLGAGNLSLSHLGITDMPEAAPMSSTTDLLQQDGHSKAASNSQKAEEESAARAVSVAYEKPTSVAMHSRPMSISSIDRMRLGGDQTPPRTDVEAGGIKRSGSVRSKLSGRRRHRGSSATTGNTIAAAIKDSAAGLANPAINGTGHRLTGFAVASSKRNKEFHGLFRSVPEDDYLIEDYSAALQRDILLHGRLYVSEGHICFSSNILGWVTNLVISFDEIVSVEKKSTAVIFPNAIVISTLHARNTFASFVARDSSYELLIGIWKISHPNLKSSLNGVVLDDAGTGDKTEVADVDGSDDDSSDESEDEVYDEDADDDVGSFTDAGVAASNAGSEVGDGMVSRKPSGAPVTNTSQANGTPPKGLENTDAVVTGAAVSSDFPGPPNHAPTECGESAEHYDRPLTDSTIPAPLGKVYSMMFGPASGQFMRKWLVEDQKSRELNYTDDKTGLDNEHKSFVFDYIKPLNAPVGPKQTKCITTNNLLAFDLDKAVSVDCSTQTPDVPSGNIFTVKTRYCLTWGPGNSTRLVASCGIEWAGKSWLKGPIEKGANDGQIQYVKDIVAALKAAVTAKPPVKGVAKKGKRKGNREVFDAEEANNQREAVIEAEQKASTWGVLEPARAIFEPLSSLLRPFISSQVIIVILFVLLAYTWFQQPRRGTGIDFPGHSTPERIVAYEEIWRREESALWNWLEDRVGLGDVYAAPISGDQQERQQRLRAKNMGKKLNDERMSDRQVDEAIRTTEERLAALKEAMMRRSHKGTVP